MNADEISTEAVPLIKVAPSANVLSIAEAVISVTSTSAAIETLYP
jgi:hypothetical protein